jgi:hypothetical protein
MNGSELGNVSMRRGLAAFAALGALILLFLWILLPEAEVYFQRLFGKLNPYLLYVGLTVLGLALLWILQQRFGFIVLTGKGTLTGLGRAAIYALVMGVVIVAVDFILLYPENINVPVPQAWLYYPAAGFAAEVIFHLLPLSLLLLALSPLAGRLRNEKLLWITILITAAVEPVFQALFSGEGFAIRNIYTTIHVYVFGLLQLMLFKRFDFISMYALRIFYYAIWHVIWGVIRLGVLF